MTSPLSYFPPTDPSLCMSAVNPQLTCCVQSWAQPFPCRKSSNTCCNSPDQSLPDHFKKHQNNFSFNHRGVEPRYLEELPETRHSSQALSSSAPPGFPSGCLGFWASVTLHTHHRMLLLLLSPKFSLSSPHRCALAPCTRLRHLHQPCLP